MNNSIPVPGLSQQRLHGSIPTDADEPSYANCWDRATELRNILSELLDATFPMAFYPDEAEGLKQLRPDDPGLVEFMWGLVLDMRVLQKRIEHLRAITGGRL